MKKIVTFGLIGGTLFLFFQKGVVAQNKGAEGTKCSSYINNSLGFKVGYEGTLIQRSKNEYVIKLPASVNSLAISRNEVHIFVDQRPFVDLPGTYGGKLYLDGPESSRLMKNRIYVDTTGSDSVKFIREYWVVYAGMGAWECVTNCCTQNADRYYLLSLVNDIIAGKPGEIIDGKKLTSEELKAKLLGEMQDTLNVMVQEFNRIVRSFEIDK